MHSESGLRSAANFKLGILQLTLPYPSDLCLRNLAPSTWQAWCCVASFWVLLLCLSPVVCPRLIGCARCAQTPCYPAQISQLVLQYFMTGETNALTTAPYNTALCVPQHHQLLSCLARAPEREPSYCTLGKHTWMMRADVIAVMVARCGAVNCRQHQQPHGSCNCLDAKSMTSRLENPVTQIFSKSVL